MKGFTKFAMRVSIFLTVLLTISWILYYLQLYHYLPKNSITDSLHAVLTILLTVLPILVLLLLFSLLMIRKPKFMRLHRNISIYLTFLFLTNFMVSFYDSHNQVITETVTITGFGSPASGGYVVATTHGKPLKLSCRKEFCKKLKPNKSYKIQYITNDLFTKVPPMVIKIHPGKRT